MIAREVPKNLCSVSNTADQKLIARVASLAEPDREIDGDIMAALGLAPAKPFKRHVNILHLWTNERGETREAPRYTGSIDAAMALIPQGVFYELWRHADPPIAWRVVFWRVGDRSRFVTHPLAAVALCVAALLVRETP